jgi:hypothetical protein
MLTNTAVRTTNPIEDVADFVSCPSVMQARTFLTGNNHPHVYYSAISETLLKVIGVEAKEAMELLNAVEIKYVAAVQKEFDAANADRKGGNAKASKPADLFRKYNKDLRTIWSRTGQAAIAAHGLFTDLYCEQSLSEGDLNTPEYLDGYTGEHIHEFASIEALLDEKIHQVTSADDGVVLLLKAVFFDGQDDFQGIAPFDTSISQSAKEVRAWAERCKKDLKWTDEQAEAFIKAQGAFDADSDEIILPDDNTDAYTPPTLLPNELVMDRELWYSSRDAVNQFNRNRSEIFKKMGTITIKRGAWHPTFRNLFTDSIGFKEVLDAVERIAKEDITTAAALYVSLAGEYGLMREDVSDVRGLQANGATGAHVNLLEYADAWEEDLLTMVQDSLDRGFPMSERQLGEFDILENGAFRASMPAMDPNPVNTASWNIAFARSAAAGSTWPQAEEAGWDNWRKEMDPVAAEAYNKAADGTNNRSKAMAAFWKLCDKRVPRPVSQIAVIVGKSGLKITPSNKTIAQTKPEQLRMIDWHIAAIKIKGNELDLSGDIKPRLLAKLQELKVGQNLWSLLAI